MSFRASVSVLLGCNFSSAGKLLEGAERGNARDVKEVLLSKPRLAAFTGFHGTLSALHRAIRNGDEDVCKVILDICRVYSDKQEAKGVSEKNSLLHIVVNQRTNKGLSPLMLACEKGYDHIVSMLIECGADPLAVDMFHCRTCLHYAAIGGHPDCVRMLVSDDVQVQDHGRRCPLRDFVTDDLQVKSAKFIDQRSYGGLTALHFATVAGSLECVQILLRAGAATMVKTDGEAFIGEDYLTPGSSPLHVAVIVGNLGIAHAILQAHAELMSAAGPASGDRHRRPWEGHSRTDIRSMRNSHRRLPFHLARDRGRRTLQHLVDPRVSIDYSLDHVRDTQQGLGTKRLSSICSLVIQKSLLSWLDDFEKEKVSMPSIEEHAPLHACEDEITPAKCEGNSHPDGAESETCLLESGIFMEDGNTSRVMSGRKSQHARHLTSDDVQCKGQKFTEMKLSRVHSDGFLSRMNRTCTDTDSLVGDREVTERGIKWTLLSGLRKNISTANLGELTCDTEFFDRADSSKGKGDLESPLGSCTNSDEHASFLLTDRECGVCLDTAVEVEFQGCRHELCISCARNLTLQDKKPPHCPFCRQLIVGFSPSQH